MIVASQHVQEALTVLDDRDGHRAAARAAHEYEKERLKIVRAKLILLSLEKTASAREAWATSHPDYQEQLERVKQLAEIDYCERDRCDAARAKIEIWRTESATNRTFAKASQ